jgi:hypothetical protein
MSQLSDNTKGAVGGTIVAYSYSTLSQQTLPWGLHCLLQKYTPRGYVAPTQRPPYYMYIYWLHLFAPSCYFRDHFCSGGMGPPHSSRRCCSSKHKMVIYQSHPNIDTPLIVARGRCVQLSCDLLYWRQVCSWWLLVQSYSSADKYCHVFHRGGWCAHHRVNCLSPLFDSSLTLFQLNT